MKEWEDNLLFVVTAFNNSLYNSVDDVNCKLLASSCMGFAQAKFQQTLNRLKWGSDIRVPTWGEFHQVSFPPPLFLPPLSVSYRLTICLYLFQAVIRHPLLGQTPLGCLFEMSGNMGGDLCAPNVGGWEFEEGNYAMTDGASYRQVRYGLLCSVCVTRTHVISHTLQIIDMAQPEKSLWVVPPGQSGNIYSSDSTNQFSLWQHTQYLPMQTTNYAIHNRLLLQPPSS